MTRTQWSELKQETEKAGRKAPTLTFLPPDRIRIEGDRGDMEMRGKDLDAIMAYLPWLDDLWTAWASEDMDWVCNMVKEREKMIEDIDVGRDWVVASHACGARDFFSYHDLTTLIDRQKEYMHGESERRQLHAELGSVKEELAALREAIKRMVDTTPDVLNSFNAHHRGIDAKRGGRDGC